MKFYNSTPSNIMCRSYMKYFVIRDPHSFSKKYWLRHFYCDIGANLIFWFDEIARSVTICV